MHAHPHTPRRRFIIANSQEKKKNWEIWHYLAKNTTRPFAPDPVRQRLFEHLRVFSDQLVAEDNFKDLCATEQKYDNLREFEEDVDQWYGLQKQGIDECTKLECSALLQSYERNRSEYDRKSIEYIKWITNMDGSLKSNIEQEVRDIELQMLHLVFQMNSLMKI